MRRPYCVGLLRCRWLGRRLLLIRLLIVSWIRAYKMKEFIERTVVGLLVLLLLLMVGWVV